MAKATVDLWEKFCHDFDHAVFECAEKGTPYMMTINLNGQNVTVEIYRDKGQMKAFTDMVQDAHKMQVGKVDA